MSTETRRRSRLWTATAITIGAIAMLLPAVASADPPVTNPGHEQACAFFFDGKVYRGFGNETISDDGTFSLSCHLKLESGPLVQRPTTTRVGLCDVLETPGGTARARCIFQL